MKSQIAWEVRIVLCELRLGRKPRSVSSHLHYLLFCLICFWQMSFPAFFTKSLQVLKTFSNVLLSSFENVSVFSNNPYILTKHSFVLSWRISFFHFFYQKLLKCLVFFPFFLFVKKKENNYMSLPVWFFLFFWVRKKVSLNNLTCFWTLTFFCSLSSQNVFPLFLFFLFFEDSHQFDYSFSVFFSFYIFFKKTC